MITDTKRVWSLVKYKLVDQWRFEYFELDIKNAELVCKSEEVAFRIAEAEDVGKIVADIYPNLDGYGESDKRHLEKPGENLVFLGETKSVIAHYWIVFRSALDSPLVRTPIRRCVIGERSAYLGSVFTAPGERGSWIVVHSISHIIRYLREKTDRERVLLVVHRDTPGAMAFYRRMGFRVLSNAAPKGVRQWLVEKLCWC